MREPLVLSILQKSTCLEKLDLLVNFFIVLTRKMRAVQGLFSDPCSQRALQTYDGQTEAKALPVEEFLKIRWTNLDNQERSRRFKGFFEKRYQI